MEAALLARSSENCEKMTLTQECKLGWSQDQTFFAACTGCIASPARGRRSGLVLATCWLASMALFQYKIKLHQMPSLDYKVLLTHCSRQAPPPRSWLHHCIHTQKEHAERAELQEQMHAHVCGASLLLLLLLLFLGCTAVSYPTSMKTTLTLHSQLHVALELNPAT